MSGSTIQETDHMKGDKSKVQNLIEDVLRDGEKLFQTEYGYFTEDGKEFVITRPETPRPWANVICPGDYGLVVSQVGTGFSWKTHASLNRITRWNQDLICEDWGKFIYIRDEESKKFWSPTWKPTCQHLESYECRHGSGYTKFNTSSFQINSELTYFVPPNDPLEIWQLKLTNNSSKERTLTLWTYLEWCLGDSPDSHREFHKTFIETECDPSNKAVFASKRLWTIANSKGQHWNRSWEYVAWHSSSETLKDLSGSKDAFVGGYHSFHNPKALQEGKYLSKTSGKWDDGIGSLCQEVALKPGESKTLFWTLGLARSKKEALQVLNRYRDISSVEKAFSSMLEFWKSHMESVSVKTPDQAFNFLANRWLKYQALSGRIWGRTGYYQAGGAFGYRDQLQDSQIFLHLEPARTKRQILMHASHQYPDGIVHHWWHPITEEGHKSRYSDDLLWLPFVVVNYLKETGDFKILKEKAPFLKEGSQKAAAPATLYQHCILAIDHSLSRRSKRGLPLIGTGDWNDGLSVAGWDNKGETVWVAQFLYGILNNFCALIEEGIKSKAVSPSEKKRIGRYQREAKDILNAINQHGWDGQWYWAASTDDGTLIGSSRSKEGKIHLNPQTWAILNGIAPKEKIPGILEQMEKYLYRDYGPLLLYPAYKTPDERIGYLTRYAPGVRENGGLYTHAGTWAVMMECYLQRNEQAWDLFKKISPIHRGTNPNLYVSEPYVTPGNVDGPDSPYYGKGGWTWYTGSAAWFYRVMTEWILGIRPEWEGLKCSPCVPESWKSFEAVRNYRGKLCKFSFERDAELKKGTVTIQWQGENLSGGIIPAASIAKSKEKELNINVRFN